MSSSWLTRCTDAGRELGRGLLHLIYPPCCHLCGRSLPGVAPFCDGCRAAFLADATPACPSCAAAVGPFAVIDGRCIHCRDETFAFEAALRLGPYEGHLREAVLRMKNHSGEILAELLGELWAEHAGVALRAVGADVLVPVPLHWRRRWLRGYNQSDAIAHGLAARLRLPCGACGLRRIRATPMQTSQTVAGRRANVRGAFAAARHPRTFDKTVLLVDDVMTTGATASEAARALVKAGARRVTAAVLTRAHHSP
ncbi:MAG TPA: ComF family protein [Gemmataceae bacterium]|nr:ComF family protein [Gemmataceae bacterium]